AVERLGQERLAVGVARDVARLVEHPDAALLDDRLGGLAEGRSFARGEREVAALLGERAGGGPPHALAGPQDDRDLSSQPQIHVGVSIVIRPAKSTQSSSEPATLIGIVLALLS